MAVSRMPGRVYVPLFATFPALSTERPLADSPNIMCLQTVTAVIERPSLPCCDPAKRYSAGLAELQYELVGMTLNGRGEDDLLVTILRMGEDVAARF